MRREWWRVFTTVYRWAVQTRNVRAAEVVIVLPEEGGLDREEMVGIVGGAIKGALHAAMPTIEIKPRQLTVGLLYIDTPYADPRKELRLLVHGIERCLGVVRNSLAAKASNRRLRLLKHVHVVNWRWLRPGRPRIPEFPDALTQREALALRPVWDALALAARFAWHRCGGCGRLIPLTGRQGSCRFCRAAYPHKVARSRAIRREGGIRALLPEEVLGDLP